MRQRVFSPEFTDRIDRRQRQPGTGTGETVSKKSNSPLSRRSRSVFSRKNKFRDREEPPAAQRPADQAASDAASRVASCAAGANETCRETGGQPLQPLCMPRARRPGNCNQLSKTAVHSALNLAEKAALCCVLSWAFREEKTKKTRCSLATCAEVPNPSTAH
jgi:hypothetical protein